MASSVRNMFSPFAAAMIFTCLVGASVEAAPSDTIHSVFIKPISEPHIEARSPMDHDWKPSGVTTSLNEIVINQGLHLGAETYSALSTALVQGGYQVATSADMADAVVEVEIERSFYNVDPPIAGGGCEPFGLFDVLVKDVKTGATIFDKTYRLQSGGGTGLTGDVLLDAGTAYNVDDCSALWSDPKTPVAAFRFAATSLSQAVVDKIGSR